MKTFLISIFVCGAIGLMGCKKTVHVEERVIELPAKHPNATLETAAQIGQELVGMGLPLDVRKQYPNLTQQKLSGLFLTWKQEDAEGTTKVFFLTGIRYTGSLPEAKAIADYCESRVKKAVAQKFSLPQ